MKLSYIMMTVLMALPSLSWAGDRTCFCHVSFEGTGITTQTANLAGGDMGRSVGACKYEEACNTLCHSQFNAGMSGFLATAKAIAAKALSSQTVETFLVAKNSTCSTHKFSMAKNAGGSACNCPGGWAEGGKYCAKDLTGAILSGVPEWFKIGTDQITGSDNVKVNRYSVTGGKIREFYKCQ